jgi:hypothetical protein
VAYRWLRPDVLADRKKELCTVEGFVQPGQEELRTQSPICWSILQTSGFKAAIPTVEQPNAQREKHKVKVADLYTQFRNPTGDDMRKRTDWDDLLDNR